MQKEYLKVLNPEQLEAVCHSGSPLLILAGAGSGKTRVITTKIAWLISECKIKPEQILAVTFTNKAAKEMYDRASKLEPDSNRALIRTFHSFGAWILRRYSELANLNPNFSIYDDDDSFTLLTKTLPSITKNQARSIIKKISRAKDYCYLPDSPYLQEIDPNPEFAEVYRQYQKRLTETGNADFGDLIMLPVMLLNEFPKVKQNLQNRFSVIMVDEYQDSNIAQFEFLKALTGEKTYICVVGDDDQSIYRFRGSEVRNILTFSENFKNTKIIRLERNYRSYSQILNVADSVVSKNSGRLGKHLIAERGTGEKPEIYFLPNQDIETELCSRLISDDIKNGGAYSDWAILYRTNAQSLNFETDFLHRKIPYRVIGTLKFYEREEIKDALAILALTANGRDEIALRRIINKPPRGLGEVTQAKLINASRQIMFEENNYKLDFKESDDFISAMEKLTKSINISKKSKQNLIEFLEMIKSLRKIIEEGLDYKKSNEIQGEGLAPFIYKILELSGLEEYYKLQDESLGTQKTANLNELANTASLYDFSIDGLTEFLEHIELDRSLADSEESVNSVNLITIHNTKGLEFKNVIITGLETGIFPRDNSDFDELEEERRLMYVACTRAKDRLYMTSCASRRLYGSLTFMQPSRLLFEIDKSFVKVHEPSNVYSQKNYTGNFAKQINIENLGGKQNNNSLNSKWKRGEKIYHDDFGYGAIIKTDDSKGELVITVQFENGFSKRFMPEYQAADITIIKD